MKCGEKYMYGSGNICVVCAEDHNGIGEHVLQLVTKARTLFNFGGGEVVVVCVGCDAPKEIEALYLYGAHRIIISRVKPQSRYDFADAVIKILSACQPELIMFPASDWGETSAAETAIHFKAGFTANCMDISMEGTEYIFTRAALNSTVFAKIAICHTQIAICTIQRNVFNKRRLAKGLKSNGTIQINDIKRTEMIDGIEILESKLIRKLGRIETLDHAKLVFGFGRGLGDEETLQLLFRVARKYKAEIVGTRAVYEMGLIEKNRQVGQSGITISPLIYVAFGISGASQHMVGIMNARRIIAVNTDPTAPIMTFSNEIIIDDCKTVLQKLETMEYQIN